MNVLGRGMLEQATNQVKITFLRPRKIKTRQSFSSALLTSIPCRQIRWQRFRAPFGVAAGKLRLASRAEERCAIQNLFLKLFEVKIDHRRDVERDELRDYQAADHYQPERSPRRTIRSIPERDRHRAKNRGQ